MKADKVSTTIELALHSLGWRNFQDLCGAIMGIVMGQSFTLFADSNDGGRDGTFSGQWQDKKILGELTGVKNGSTVVQCKFTSKIDQTLSLSIIADELSKIDRLVQKGICDNYVLMTNARVTGKAEEKIKKAILGRGVKNVYIFDGNWVCAKIKQNQSLRLYVPRVYGLGDLSQILDARANEQARELLDQLDGLSTFVVTQSYKKAAKALQTNGFVMLLGEPSSGKSVIAATLAMASVDRWDSLVVRVSSAEEFKSHWNVNEPNQFFWIDDVFGAVRHDESLTDNWTKVLQEMMTAIKKGAKVVMTSRDYIYRSAKPLLKEYAYPMLKESQVVIDVSLLSKDEKEKILYNHIKKGNQSAAFRSDIKPSLADIASIQKFLPEVARRLGNKAFTKNLNAKSKSQVTQFMENPSHYLIDVFNELDADHKAALALVYKTNRLKSPVKLIGSHKDLIERLGADPAKTRAALGTLEKTFLRYTKSKAYWSFHHPTLREGFARFVMADQELSDVVVDGLTFEELIEQVDCGSGKTRGQLLRIPTSGYQRVIKRFEEFDRIYKKSEFLSRYSLLISVIGFLARSSKKFMKMFLEANPKFIEEYILANLGGHILGNSEIILLSYLHTLGLLPESGRKRVIEYYHDAAISIPDSNWLTWHTASILINQKEKDELLNIVKEKVVDRLSEIIEEWEMNESAEDETYYEGLREALSEYHAEFEDDEVTTILEEGIRQVDELTEEHARRQHQMDDDALYEDQPRASEKAVQERSIFDDIDQ